MTTIGIVESLMSMLRSKRSDAQSFIPVQFVSTQSDLENETELVSPTPIFPSEKLTILEKEFFKVVDALEELRNQSFHAERAYYDNEYGCEPADKNHTFKEALDKISLEIKNVKKSRVKAQQAYFAQLYDEMLIGITYGFRFYRTDPSKKDIENPLDFIPYNFKYRIPQFEIQKESIKLEFDEKNNRLQIPIQFCEKTKVLSLGLFVSKRPYIEFIPETYYGLKKEIFSQNGIPPLTLNEPEFDLPVNNRIYSMILRPQFNRLFRLLNYRIWVGDDKQLIKRFCRSEGTLKNGYICRFHRYRDLIIKAANNNEHQLIPAIMYFGVDVGELKNRLGSLWKPIFNNSPSRNHLIFDHLYTFGDHSIENHDHGVKFTTTNRYIVKKYLFPNSVEKLSLLQQIPSSILKRAGLFKDIVSRKPNYEYAVSQFSSIVWASKILIKEKKISNHDRLKELIHTLRDTLRMAQTLSLPFSFQWSYRRMMREHQNYTLEYYKSQNEHYEYKFKYAWPEKIDCNDGIVARLLTSNSMLFTEGKEMHHCVGSYHDMVMNGDCIIYSLISEEQNRSTVQISFRDSSEFSKHSKSQSVTAYCAQNRSKYNDQVTEPFNIAANFCVNLINKVLKENT
jgi:hypothetical protein